MLLASWRPAACFDVVAALRSAVLPAAIVNVVIAPPVYVVMRLAKPAARRRRLSF